MTGKSRCEYSSPQSPVSPPPPLSPPPCPVKVVVSSPPKELKEDTREKEMTSSGGEYLSSAAGQYVSIESCNK